MRTTSEVRGVRAKRLVHACQPCGLDRSWFRNSKACSLSDWVEVGFDRISTAFSIWGERGAQGQHGHIDSCIRWGKAVAASQHRSNRVQLGRDMTSGGGMEMAEMAGQPTVTVAGRRAWMGRARGCRTHLSLHPRWSIGTMAKGRRGGSASRSESCYNSGSPVDAASSIVVGLGDDKATVESCLSQRGEAFGAGPGGGASVSVRRVGWGSGLQLCRQVSCSLDDGFSWRCVCVFNCPFPKVGASSRVPMWGAFCLGVWRQMFGQIRIHTECSVQASRTCSEGPLCV